MMYYLTLPIISTTVELNNVVHLLTADKKRQTGVSLVVQDCDALQDKMTASL